MIVLTKKFITALISKLRVSLAAMYRLPQRFSSALGRGPAASLIRIPVALANKARALKCVGRAMNALTYWTGWHKANMKPSEWLVVVIGVVAGILILHLSSSSSSTSISATLVPQPRPTPVSNNLESRAGQEWQCVIVEDNLNQLNLICEKGGQDSPILVQVEAIGDRP